MVVQRTVANDAASSSYRTGAMVTIFQLFKRAIEVLLTLTIAILLWGTLAFFQPDWLVAIHAQGRALVADLAHVVGFGMDAGSAMWVGLFLRDLPFALLAILLPAAYVAHPLARLLLAPLETAMLSQDVLDDQSAMIEARERLERERKAFEAERRRLDEMRRRVQAQNQASSDANIHVLPQAAE